MAGYPSSFTEIARNMQAASRLLSEVALDQWEDTKEDKDEEKEPMREPTKDPMAGWIESTMSSEDNPYHKLIYAFEQAYKQASQGKGKDRHAKDDEPFEDQKICEITRRVGLGYPLGQAIKKAIEAPRLGGAEGQAELLGAINYLAAAYIVMGEEEDETL